MDFLKKRPVAILLAIVIVLGSTLLSVNVKLGKKCAAVTNGFYSGVTYDGYKHPAVSAQLENISAAALGMASLGSSYTGVDVKAVQTAQEDLNSSIQNGSVSQIYDRYAALIAETDKLDAAMKAQKLSDRDATGLSEYESTISAAQGVIEKSGYNETVRDFLSGTYNVFPANMFAGICGVKAPQLFE